MLEPNNETKNMIMAAALSFLVIVVWQFLFPPQPPQAPDEPARVEREAPAGDDPAPQTGGEPAPGVARDAAPGVGGAPGQPVDREAALARTERVPIASPRLRGSISLKGGRLDDLHLTDYHVTLDPDSPTVTLLSPIGTADPYYAVYGWTPARGATTGATPDANTRWRVESGETLAPGAPVTLAWRNDAGLTFRRVFAIDDDYMLTVTQSVENGAAAPLSLSPYGILARHGVPETIGFYILHEGAIGEFDGELKELDYDDLADLQRDPAEGGPAERVSVAANGWIGFTDKYWMTAMAPGPRQTFAGVFKQAGGGRTPVFQTDMRLPIVTVAPGATETVETLLFAGAKEVRTLQTYGEKFGILGFEDAVDWGWFFFLTKPMFALLSTVQGVIGNMGWSIIVLTLIVKTALFPLAYKSFVSMSKMKKLQPEMEKIKERAGDDKQKLQQEMMGLYKKEKVNPAAGCLPILLQIPIFFSLYKVIFVTLELRHAPFILWIRDLSAPDPSSWVNLFGVLPYDVGWVPALIGIGFFPILMGVTMWMQQKLNPAPADPMQAQIFGLMPWVFMFLLGGFASGLVIYWCANNILTFAQQFIIMRSQGVHVDFFGNVRRSFKRRKAE